MVEQNGESTPEFHSGYTTKADWSTPGVRLSPGKRKKPPPRGGVRPAARPPNPPRRPRRRQAAAAGAGLAAPLAGGADRLRRAALLRAGACASARKRARSEGWKVGEASPQALGDSHWLKLESFFVIFFPLLVLKVTYDYWKYFPHFFRGAAANGKGRWGKQQKTT